MCRIDDQLRVHLWDWNRNDLDLHPRAIPLGSVSHPLQLPRWARPGRWWRPLFAAVERRNARRTLRSAAVWHSGFYERRPSPTKAPWVVSVYDVIHEDFPEVGRSEEGRAFLQRKRTAISGADILVCISETTRSALERVYGIDRHKTRVVPLGISEAFAAAAGQDISRTPASNPYLLYVGQRDRYKAFRTLLEGFATWKHNKDVDLRVVGPPWSRRERAMLGNLGVSPRVILDEGVSDTQLARLYGGALALVYPSLAEGFGLPLVEAIACGCPVVASRIPSTVEVAEDTPEYFEPGEVEGLRDALNRVYQTPAVRVGEDREVRRLRQRILNRYNWDRTANELLSVYRELV